MWTINQTEKFDYKLWDATLKAHNVRLTDSSGHHPLNLEWLNLDTGNRVAAVLEGGWREVKDKDYIDPKLKKRIECRYRFFYLTGNVTGQEITKFLPSTLTDSLHDPNDHNGPIYRQNDLVKKEISRLLSASLLA